MGFSGGRDYTDLDGNKFHLEAKGRGIAIWGPKAMVRILMLSPEDARALADDLLFHAHMVDGLEYHPTES